MPYSQASVPLVPCSSSVSCVKPQESIGSSTGRVLQDTLDSALTVKGDMIKEGLAAQVKAEQSLMSSLLHLRGSMQREWQKQQRQAWSIGTDPTHAALYNICGPLQQEMQVIRGSSTLPELSRKCFAALVKAIHLAIQNSHQVQLLKQKVACCLSESSAETSKACKKEELTKNVCRQMTLNVGMSGGADSTLVLVLACALRDDYGYQVQAVHCIHGLDPDDEIWLQHNRKLCSKLQVTLITPVLHIVYGGGVSPEEVSRKERYRALLELTSQETDCLLLGHQADDQVENFMLALKRGSGPQGLSGMKVLTEDERGTLVRPLLFLYKVEVEQILSDLGFTYVYDLSNGYLKFERNYMRLKVMPVLRERFAGIDKAILRSQRLCAIEHDLAQRYIAELAIKAIQPLSQIKSIKIYPALAQAQSAYGKTDVAQVTKGKTYFAQALDRKADLILNTQELNIYDQSLMFMLIREYVSQVLSQSGYAASVDYNLVECCYELLLRPHDANGCLTITGTPFVAATFLHYLCVYRPWTQTELQSMQGQYLLVENQPLQIGSVRYTLVAVDKDLVLSKPWCGLVFKLPAAVKQVQVSLSSSHVEYEAASLLTNDTTANPVNEVMANSANEVLVNLVNEAGASPVNEATATPVNKDKANSVNEDMADPVSETIANLGQAVVCLDFDYTQSLKLKPRFRQHSREIKKLFIEHEIAPWQRKAQPLVRALVEPQACQKAQHALHILQIQKQELEHKLEQGQVERSELKSKLAKLNEQQKSLKASLVGPCLALGNVCALGQGWLDFEQGVEDYYMLLVERIEAS